MNNTMSLTNSLRIAAILLILASVYQYVTLDLLPIKSIVVAHVLLLLSIFSDKHKQRVSVVSLGLSIVVPIGAWRMYQSNNATLGLFIFNLVIFVYLAYVALITFTNKSKEKL